MRGRSTVRWVLSAVLVLGIGGAVRFNECALAALGNFLVVSEPPERSDLVYVLAGDFFGSRVLVGAELGVRGYATKVLLSGGDRDQGERAIRYAVEHGYPRNLLFTVRHNARSTIEEAQAMGPIFRELGARRIVLVTSAYHSRRASLVFRMFLPGFQFTAVDAPDSVFAPSSWWKSGLGRQLFFSEYWKLTATPFVRLGYALFGQ
jgi:uncharacterized SAM-binding protein YcdF (DUF218 family)